MNSLYLKIIEFFKKIKRGFGDYGRQAELDKKLVYSLSGSRIPSFGQIKYVQKFLNPKELWLWRLSFLTLLVSLIFLGTRFYLTHIRLAPVRGGEYIEGLVGSPKYINPLYSGFSDADSDISGLVFSSLFKRGKDGQLINDLAEGFEIGENNKTYTFKIRKDAKWHNGAPLTVDDILFTFNAIKDNRYKSPLKSSFGGVEVEKINEETVKFVLAEPYAAFGELLTFGVLPADFWYQIPPSSAPLAELNLKPVGSGPYKFKSLIKDKAGQIKTYNLTVNEDYYGAKPKINDLTFKFFPNFEEAISALNENSVDGISYLPKDAENSLVSKNSLFIHKLSIPQLTAIFFNQKNNEFLKEKGVRQALALAINKDDVITDVFGGDAQIANGPIVLNNFIQEAGDKNGFNKKEAVKLLEGAGWKTIEVTVDDLKKAEVDKTEENVKTKKETEAKLSAGAGKWRYKDGKFLSVKLTAVETDESSKTAEIIKKFWEDLGVKTTIELIKPVQIGANVIKPRNFEALLYGQIMGADPDPYAFWHSSQIGENGLNIADYSNKEVDKLIEDARLISSKDEREKKYKQFQDIVVGEAPAVFLYSPFYTYVQSKKIKGFGLSSILTPQDRFADINNWYIKTGKKLVW
ncbi:peptide ABC transporter substrate-binding protein [Candidatus Falkowbacteria bacterium]|nr:peptide ABC transporter substrate-binding protein [Candidatus Falkowbacteria bacterium]